MQLENCHLTLTTLLVLGFTVTSFSDGGKNNLKLKLGVFQKKVKLLCWCFAIGGAMTAVKGASELKLAPFKCGLFLCFIVKKNTHKEHRRNCCRES